MLSCLIPLDAIFRGSLIRDGRDVVCSLLQQNWIDLSTGKSLEYTRDTAAAAQYWVESVVAGRRIRENPSATERYVELRYESLIDDPQMTLTPLLKTIGETWDPQMLNFFEVSDSTLPNSEKISHSHALGRPLNSSAKGRWRKEMSESDKNAFKHVAAQLLIDLDYADSDDW